MKDLSYTTFFGKKVEHKTALKERIESNIVDIMMQENQISEKDFKRLDEIIVIAKNVIDDALYNEISELYNQGKRLQYIAEKIWDEKQSLISEKKNEFDKLKDNKVKLTDEERAEVMKKKAVWHQGKNGAESPAVWKSKDDKGKITYVTHTHRAYDTASTVGGAIKKYHDFIKDTA